MLNSDLISRNAAINAVYYKPNYKMAIEVLKEVPAVDAAPVVHGRWIKPQEEESSEWYKVKFSQCSVCGKKDYMARQMEKLFCPYCGAKMDGGGSDG